MKTPPVSFHTLPFAHFSIGDLLFLEPTPFSEWPTKEKLVGKPKSKITEKMCLTCGDVKPVDEFRVMYSVGAVRRARSCTECESKPKTMTCVRCRKTLPEDDFRAVIGERNFKSKVRTCNSCSSYKKGRK